MISIIRKRGIMVCHNKIGSCGMPASTLLGREPCQSMADPLHALCTAGVSKQARAERRWAPAAEIIMELE